MTENKVQDSNLSKLSKIQKQLNEVVCNYKCYLYENQELKKENQELNKIKINYKINSHKLQNQIKELKKENDDLKEEIGNIKIKLEQEEEYNQEQSKNYKKLDISNNKLLEIQENLNQISEITINQLKQENHDLVNKDNYFDNLCEKIDRLEYRLKEANRKKKIKKIKNRQAIAYCEDTGNYCEKHRNWYWHPEECIDCEHH
jgi:SMC interacting uncharacterized protein involved in chromosome segregation